jgi:hypothetical protein
VELSSGVNLHIRQLFLVSTCIKKPDVQWFLFIYFEIDSIHVLLRIIIIIAVEVNPPSNRSYVSFQRLTANIIKRLLIAQVSGKVVIKKNQSYSIFLYHFVVSDTKFDRYSAFSYSKRTKFSMWTSTSASSQAILSDW